MQRCGELFFQRASEVVRAPLTLVLDCVGRTLLSVTFDLALKGHAFRRAITTSSKKDSPRAQFSSAQKETVMLEIVGTSELSSANFGLHR